MAPEIEAKMIDLEPIKKRVASLESLPWHSSEGEIMGADGRVMARTWRDLKAGWGPPDEIQRARFIMHAPTDIAFLVEEVERLRAALEACSDPWYSADDHVSAEGCPDNACPACARQEEEAREAAREALGYENARP